MRFIFSEIKQKIISNWELVIAIFLWFCVWGTYNTDISRIFSLRFPNGFFDLAHGLRSLLPFIALIYSGIALFKNRYFFKNLFWSPIGLLIVYSLLGIISSIFSREPLMAIYWGILYGGVLFFLLVFLNDKEILKKIIIINFFIAGVIALVLTILFLAHPGVINSLTYNFLICSQRPYEGLGGIYAESNTLGMAGTRPTGLGRYAGITAIACLGFFFFTRKKFKINWFVFFAIFLAILLFSKGKTEMVAFIASIIFLIWAFKKINFLYVLGTIFIIIISGIVIFYNIPCTNISILGNNILNITNISEPQNNLVIKDVPVIKNVPNNNNEPEQEKKNIVEIQQSKTLKITSKTASVVTLSGRTSGVWKDSWYLFLRNPLFGFGFQADRYFLDNQHAHNTIIHTLLQAGILGTLAFVSAFILLLFYVINLFRKTCLPAGREKQFLIIITAVLIFFAVRAITESVAFFSADWLFVAPIIAYIQCLNNEKKNTNLVVKNCLRFYLHNESNRQLIKKILLFFENNFLSILGKIWGKKLLNELTPYNAIGFEEKIRLGNLYDGGYVVPSKLLLSIEVAYCYGVADHIDFEEDLIKHINIPVRLYDHTVEGLPVKGNNFFFKKQGIAKKKHGDFDTFENHLIKNADTKKSILLKMDIEGAEWQVMSDIIDKFSENLLVIVLEIHRLYRYEKIVDYTNILKKINSKFTLIHIHGNNNSGFSVFDNKKIPNVCELTFVNNKYIKDKTVMTLALPSKIDYPNIQGRKDVVLDFWIK